MLEFLRERLNRPIVAIVAVGLLAGVLRFTHLGFPEHRIFDEYYYPKSACIFLGYSDVRCDINSSEERYWRTARNDTGAWVHPPLGKWMIAVGELVSGTDSYGWRVSSAVTGTLSVVALALIAQLLFGSPLWTFVAGLLLATENLNFVQSRTSMLDIFVTFWIVVGFLFLLLDRRWIDRRMADPGAPPAEATTIDDIDPPVATRDAADRRVPQPLWRPWRFVAGVAFGCAFATKWSGITAIMGAVVLAFAWEVVRRKARQIPHPFWRTLQIETFGLVLAFLAVPALVYVVSYAGWFFHFGFHLGEWAKMQAAAAAFQEHLTSIDPVTHEPIHPYLAQAWKWILLWRPVVYCCSYYPSSGIRQVIYANGNPAIFWGAIVAIPYAAFAWWRVRDWRAGFVVVAVLFLYVPWFLVSRPQFFFYATPITPFFVLACVYAVRDLSELRVAGAKARPYLPVAVAFVIVSVGLFIFFWPTMTGAPLTDAAFKLRTWFPTWI